MAVDVAVAEYQCHSKAVPPPLGEMVYVTPGDTTVIGLSVKGARDLVRDPIRAGGTWDKLVEGPRRQRAAQTPR